MLTNATESVLKPRKVRGGVISGKLCSSPIRQPPAYTACRPALGAHPSSTGRREAALVRFGFWRIPKRAHGKQGSVLERLPFLRRNQQQWGLPGDGGLAAGERLSTGAPPLLAGNCRACLGVPLIRKQ